MTITVQHGVARDDLALGLVCASGVRVADAGPALAAELERCVGERRASPLNAAAEALRQGSRAILRHGTYRPTGRGKPASEYLLRAATTADEVFPRINGPVDACNLVSLAHGVAISLWDLDLAGTTEFEFRHGAPGESYVFNAAGQVLQLADLICGCGREAGGGSSRPLVTPVKDSLATKLRASSTRVAGAIYYPLAAGDEAHLRRVTAELLRWLATCGPDAAGTLALARAGETVSL